MSLSYIEKSLAPRIIGVYVYFAIIFVIITTGCGPNPQLLKYQASVDSTFYSYIEKYPEYATEIGIYDNGDKWQDISSEFINKELDLFKKELEFLRSIDTTGWDIDYQINYTLDVAGYRSTISSYEVNPWYLTRPDYYFQNCKDGILRLIYRKPEPSPERLLLAFERIKKTPEFLNTAGENLETFEKGPLAHMILNAMQLARIVDATCSFLLTDFPDMKSEIITARDSAKWSITNLGQRVIMKKYPQGEDEFRPLGRSYYDSILFNDFMLDFGSDSVYSIAEYVYNRCDSIMNQIEGNIDIDSTDLKNQFSLRSEIKDTVINNYYNEIKYIKKYLENEKILNVPKKSINLRIVRMPDWLVQTGINSDYYIAPAPLDSTDSGILYLYESPSQFSTVDTGGGYLDNIRKNIINFILPGYHYRNHMTERELIPGRKLQNNSMFNGWNLYMEEIFIDMGFWGDNYYPKYDFYKYMRLAALASMLEIALNADEISIDSAYNFMINRLGEDKSVYDRDNVFAVTVYAAQNTSLIMGYYLFKDMQEKARAREGDNFDLREFHDKVLSEGRIPPTLIARKYGWE
ncbi:MAG: DUF885 family protein [Candidatus Hodarchaeales archaeon]